MTLPRTIQDCFDQNLMLRLHTSTLQIFGSYYKDVAIARDFAISGPDIGR